MYVERVLILILVFAVLPIIGFVSHNKFKKDNLTLRDMAIRLHSLLISTLIVMCMLAFTVVTSALLTQSMAEHATLEACASMGCEIDPNVDLIAGAAPVPEEPAETEEVADDSNGEDEATSEETQVQQEEEKSDE